MNEVRVDPADDAPERETLGNRRGAGRPRRPPSVAGRAQDPRLCGELAPIGRREGDLPTARLLVCDEPEHVVGDAGLGRL